MIYLRNGNSKTTLLDTFKRVDVALIDIVSRVFVNFPRISLIQWARHLHASKADWCSKTGENV